MKVMGLTDGLRSAAERACAEGFRAWIPEVENGTWGNWAEMMRYYPRACRTGNDEAHFPLTADGTGVRAMVFFPAKMILLGCIAPAPAAGSMTANQRFSISPKTAPTNTIP